jgi:hypothetical protein
MPVNVAGSRGRGQGYPRQFGPWILTGATRLDSTQTDALKFPIDAALFAPVLIQDDMGGVSPAPSYRLLFAIVLDKYHPKVLLELLSSVPRPFLPPYYWSFFRVQLILGRANL